MKTNLKSVDLNDHIKEKEISEHNIDAVLKLLYMQENVKDETDYNFLYDNTDFYQYEPIPKQPLIEFSNVTDDRYGKDYDQNSDSAKKVILNNLFDNLKSLLEIDRNDRTKKTSN